jgi:hypothetical protein
MSADSHKHLHCYSPLLVKGAWDDLVRRLDQGGR